MYFVKKTAYYLDINVFYFTIDIFFVCNSGWIVCNAAKELPFSIDRVHICRLSIKMNGDDCFCVWSDRLFNQLWIEVVGLFIRFNGNDRSSYMSDSKPGGDVGI